MGFQHLYPPEPLLALIGKAQVAWARVELEFDMLFISEVVFKGRSSGSTAEIPKGGTGKPLEVRIALLLNAFGSGTSKRGLTAADIQPTLSRLTNLKRLRDRLTHGRLAVALTDAGVDQNKVNLSYRSWKANKDWEIRPVTAAQLRTQIIGLEKLFDEFFDIHMGRPPQSKGSVSAPRSP